MRICVLTRLGLRREELPCAFHLGGRRLQVVDILDRWNADGHQYFEVCVDDGRRFILELDLTLGCWKLAAVYAASRPRPALKKQPVRSPLKPATL